MSTRRNVSFTLDFDNCDMVNLYSDGVELSLRLDDSLEWIPVAYYFLSDPNLESDRNLFIGDMIGDILIMRGYQVVQSEVPPGNPSPFMIQVCDLSGPVQFRWLQTASFFADGSYRDIWILDNVEIYHQDESGEQRKLLEDTFNGPLKYVSDISIPDLSNLKCPK